MLSSLLPTPKRSFEDDENIEKKKKKKKQKQQPTSTALVLDPSQILKQNEKPKPKVYTFNPSIPRYGERAKQKWYPKSQEDFDDGGAYPEVILAQFPLELGKKTASQPTPAPVANKSMDIALRDQSEGKIVYSKFTDLIEQTDPTLNLEKPSEEKVQNNVAETKKILEKITDFQAAPGYLKNFEKMKTEDQVEEKTVIYRYIPTIPTHIKEDAQKMATLNTETRIVKIEEEDVDPFEPPRFKTSKLPRGPPPPPVPVMHSQKEKLTKDEMANFKIPPSVSNWKNPKGFTVPLENRLGADGRNLFQSKISEGFAKLNEAMNVAEEKAREETALRNAYERKRKLKDKELEEQRIAELAQKAREGVYETETMTESEAESTNKENETPAADPEEERRREALRRKRQHEIEYENRRKKYIEQRKHKISEEDRDISEKVALGEVSQSAGFVDGGVDASLVNYTNSGLDSGFGADDSYNVYSEPLFTEESAAHIYKSRSAGDSNMDADTVMRSARFKDVKQFSGGPQEQIEKETENRSGPVQFEKESDIIRREKEMEEREKRVLQEESRDGRRNQRNQKGKQRAPRQEEQDETEKYSRRQRQAEDEDRPTIEGMDDEEEKQLRQQIQQNRMPNINEEAAAEEDPFGFNKLLGDANKGEVRNRKNLDDVIGKKSTFLSAAAGGSSLASSSSSSRGGDMSGSGKRKRIEFEAASEEDNRQKSREDDHSDEDEDGHHHHHHHSSSSSSSSHKRHKHR